MKIELRSTRAKNGTRTRDPNLGKVMLYQLSYFRKYIKYASGIFKPRQGCVNDASLRARLCSTN